jgi:hypothetical protein
LGVNGSGNNGFAAITIVASLCSLVNAMQKEERENEKKEGQIETKRKIKCSWGPLGNMKEGFQFHFNIKRPCW